MVRMSELPREFLSEEERETEVFTPRPFSLSPEADNSVPDELSADHETNTDQGNKEDAAPELPQISPTKPEELDKRFILLMVGLFVGLSIFLVGGVVAWNTLSQPKMSPSPTPQISGSPSAELRDAGASGASASPTPSSSSTPTPSPSVKPTPSPSPSPTPSPKVTPTPSPSPVAKPNVYYDGFPMVSLSETIEDLKKPLPEGDVSSAGNYTFYFRHFPRSLWQAPKGLEANSTLRINESDRLNMSVLLRNSEFSAAGTTKLRVLVKSSEYESSQMYDVSSLTQGQSADITFSNIFTNKPGTYTIELQYDPDNLVPETTETDNTFRFTLVVEKDTTRPYLSLYKNIIARYSGDQTWNAYCFNYREIFTRDNLDALEPDGPSKTTQVRWQENQMGVWSDWVNYMDLSKISLDHRCYDIEPGKQVEILVQSRDRNGNVTELKKTAVF